MLFVMIGHDAAGSAEKRPVHRPAHLAHLEDLAARGTVALAGPFTDGSGSLVVIEAESLAQAWEVVAADPYVRNGVFESVELRPFKWVLPRNS